MPLRFHRPLEKMDIWSASSDGFSFVISFESPAGPGFHGRPGYMATWRPLYQNKGAIRISGSPFRTFAEAEEACDEVIEHLATLDDLRWSKQ
jgi:hypothetical protein